MNEFKAKRVSVIGAARSGIATALELRKLGASVFLSDLKAESQWSNSEDYLAIVNSLKQNGLEYEFGSHSSRVYDCQLMVTSPGVPADSEVLVSAKKRGIKIISELELGFMLCKGKIAAITGSNGKTTTTALVGEIFSHSGLQYRVAGNIGTPFASVAGEIGEKGWGVLEVSTFQLEWIDKFKPKVAAVLNITPDHLDRHGSMEVYKGLKLRIFANQDSRDWAIINADDAQLRSFNPQSQKVEFSSTREVDNGCFVEKGTLLLNRSGNIQAVLPAAEIGIKGPHNLANACAASAIAMAAGIDIKVIAAGLKSFPGVEHRLERVGLIGGVSFINDSKATNVDAVFWALQSVSPPIVLIAGGKDKAGDFRVLSDLVRKNVKAIILIGQAADKIAGTFDGLTKLVRSKDMSAAVKLGYELAKPEGTVLLSPGCASFDMFDNFEHRGHVFKEAVKGLDGTK